MNMIRPNGVSFDHGQDQNILRLVSDPGDINDPFKKIKGIGEKYFIKYEANRKYEVTDSNTSFFLDVIKDQRTNLSAILENETETVVVWADAHESINLLLDLLKEQRLVSKNLIYFGPGELEPRKKDFISSIGIQYFSYQEINPLGAQEILEMALHRADPFGVYPIHLSIDVDLFDSQERREALRPRLEDIFLMGGVLSQTGRLKSMSLVESNALLCEDAKVQVSADVILKFLETSLEQVFDYQKIKHLFKITDFSFFEDVI